MPDSSFPDTPLEGKPELTHCDREPIHIPESIQPHGALIAVDLPSERIVAASDNCDAMLGRSVSDLLASALHDVLPQLTPALHAAAKLDEGERADRQRLEVHQTEYVVSAHHCGGIAILELESTCDEAPNVADLVGQLFIQIERQPIAEAYQTVVDQVRRFSGFDRVMLYQFLPGGHGSVIAEAKHDDQEAFLGLHYPATDIPEPARRLYELNWIRTIGDVGADAVPLRHEPGANPRPLDMTYSNLRAISPIHIEYLRNMGVGASMSISVMDGNRLWGLIACHHNTAKIVTPVTRASCAVPSCRPI